MRKVYELDVYKLAERLSDMIWSDTKRINKLEPKLNAFINKTK